ncbi:hypothetical protein, partial [Pseudomonas sp. AB12(2023)]
MTAFDQTPTETSTTTPARKWLPVLLVAIALAAVGTVGATTTGASSASAAVPVGSVRAPVSLGLAGTFAILSKT